MIAFPAGFVRRDLLDVEVVVASANNASAAGKVGSEQWRRERGMRHGDTRWVEYSVVLSEPVGSPPNCETKMILTKKTIGPRHHGRQGPERSSPAFSQQLPVAR